MNQEINLETEFILPAAAEKSVVRAVSGVMYRFARVVLSDTQYASIEPESNCPISIKSLSYTYGTDSCSRTVV